MGVLLLLKVLFFCTNLKQIDVAMFFPLFLILAFVIENVLIRMGQRMLGHLTIVVQTTNTFKIPNQTLILVQL